MSSKPNTVCLMDPKGEMIGSQTFPNTLSGAEAMKSWLLKIRQENNFTELKIATEANSLAMVTEFSPDELAPTFP